MFKKTILCKICLLFLLPIAANAEKEIGVFGGIEFKDFFSQRIKCQILTEEDFNNPENLSKFTAVIFSGNRSYKYIKALREYVKNGGVLYSSTMIKPDLSGASWTGYSSGIYSSVKAEKEHILTRGLPIGKWQPITYPKNINLNIAASHVFKQEDNSCDILAVAKLTALEKVEKNDKVTYKPSDKYETGPWLAVYPYGRGLVIFGLSGAVRYAINLQKKSKVEPATETLLSNLIDFISNYCYKSIVETDVVSAMLCMEVNDSNDNATYPKEIYINGELAGYVPEWRTGWSDIRKIPITGKAFKKLATKNTIMIKNISKDPFKIRNIYVEVVTKKGHAIRTNVNQDVLCSIKYGWQPGEGKTSVYNGAPLPVFSINLPTDILGFISQPEFVYDIPEVKESNTGKEWKNIEDALIDKNTKHRTSCWMICQNFISVPKEEILKKLESFNAGDFAVKISEKEDNNSELLEKIDWLREKGYRFTFVLSKTSSSGWIPGTDAHNKFFKRLQSWAKRSDCIMVDEWYFSPALLRTEGSSLTVITGDFKNGFKMFSNLEDTDADWAFKNPFAADPRSLKLWNYCSKIGNDFMREVVSVAKAANPKVKTQISYITHNWNKLVSGLDSCVKEFDEILNCQTYWYGRHSFDPLDAPKITNAIGVGKLFQEEYPDKFSWLGFGPEFAGGKPLRKESSKFQKYSSFYHNTPEELVPYLATLYASGSGVFVFIVFNGNAHEDGADDDFADAIRLVSQLVPHIKDYVKSDIAYCYDPAKTWEATRTKPAAANYATNEGDIVSLGYIQQFLDVDVVKNSSGYKNVIVSGKVIPPGLDYTNDKKVYFMYNPLYELKENTVISASFEKIGMKGASILKTGYYKIDGDISIDKAMLHSAYAIQNPVRALRTAINLDERGKEYCIGSENGEGNVRINSLCPYYTSQSVMKSILREDFKKLGWMKRDCPQINGKTNIVAVAFREIRKAVLDFGDEVSYNKVKIVIFNGKDGILRNETVEYKKGMEIELRPLNVLVASGIK